MHSDLLEVSRIHISSLSARAPVHALFPSLPTGFGSTGFGASQPAQTAGGLFGQQPAQQPQQSQPFSFGATNTASTTPAFGAARPPATTAGFGGFGATTNPASSTTPSTGFSFGATPAQPQQQTGAFGSTTSTFGAPQQPAGGLFGQQQQQPAAGGFGAFGQTNAAAATGQVTHGTATLPYDPVREDTAPNEHIKDRKTWDVQQSIVVMPAYSKYSTEELRIMDYQQGRSKGTMGPGAAPPATTGFGGFGASTSTTTGGAFGAQQPSTGFGASQPATTGGLFGQQQQQPQPQQTGGLFGQQTQQTGGGLFGAKPPTTGFGATASTTGGLFGQNQPQQQTGGLFGSSTTQPGQQPSTGFSFGGAANTATTAQAGTGFSFGANNQQQQNKPAFGGFGATSTTQQPSTGFSFGATGQQQQQQQPGQTGTGFGATGSTGFSFGAKPATTGGLFGAATSQPAGQTGTAAPSFGGFGAQQQQQQQNKPAFSFGGGFGATSGAATGTTAAPATGGGLFGSATTTTTSQPGGLFGSTTAAAPAAGGFSFGGQQQQPGQTGTTGGFGSGGLFGAKPAGQTGTTTGGLFGSTTAQQPGQQQTGTGFGAGSGGLFGGAAAKPGGFSFGSGTTGGGLFGGAQQNQQNQQQQQPQQGGGLFGSSTTTGGTGLFGSSTNQQQAGTTGGGLFGGGSSLFGGGATGTSTGGLFGQSTAQPAQGGQGLFGSTLGQQQNQQQQGQLQQQQPSIQASLDANPYGTDSLFASNLPQQAQGAAAQAPLPFNVAPKHKPPLVAPFRASPRSAAKITRLRGSTPVTSGFAGRESTPGSVREGTPGAYIRFGTPGRAGSPSLFKGLSDEQSQPLSSQAFVSRPSSKRLVLDEPGENSFAASRRAGSVPHFDTTSSPLTSASAGYLRSGTAAPTAGRVTFSPALETRAEAVRPGGGDLSFASSVPSRRGNLFASSQAPDETPSKPVAAAAIKTAAAASSRNGRDLGRTFAASPATSGEPTAASAKKGEYFLEPSLSALRTARFEELAAVHGFIVGRQGVGKVEFLEPVDLTTLPDLTDIAGGVVQFRLKEIVVYPEEEDIDPRNPRDGAKRNYDPVPKAAEGTGLNVPARVSLEGCWPTDRATREPIKDANHPRVKQHMNKLKNKTETEFVDYEPVSGTWTFKVKHFSRYGLDDSDEDEEDSQGRPVPANAAAAAAAAAKSQRVTRVSKAARENAADDDDDAPPPSRMLQDADSEKENMFGDDSPRLADDASSAMHESELGTSPPSGLLSLPAANTPRANRSGLTLARSRSATPLAEPGFRGSAARPMAPGVEPRRVQVMQASFFGQDDSQLASGAVVGATQPNPRKHARHSTPGPARAAAASKPAPAPAPATATAAATEADDEAALVAPPPQLEVARPARKLTRLDLARSAVKGSEGLAMDAGLALGRSFRVGWGPDGTMVHNGKIVGAGAASAIKAAQAPEEQQPSNTVSTVKLEKFNMFKDEATAASEAAKAEQLLQVLLEHSIVEEDERGCPVAYTQFDTRFRDYARAFELKDRSFEACLWRLGVVLFDEIDLKLPAATSAQAADRVMNLRRKTALSNWLRHTVAGTVETEARAHVAASRKTALVFSYLSGNQLERAAQAAVEAGDVRLATLIAQAGGDEETKADISEQLLVWRQEGVDAHMTRDHRRIYEVLSGNVTLSRGTEARGARDPIEQVADLAVAEGLDWKRAFGLHLWYECGYETALGQSFGRYEESVGGAGGTAPPLPFYREGSQLGSLRLRQIVQAGSFDRDGAYELIKLYAQPSHDLETALNACGYGASNADARLPWHLYDLLSRVLRLRDLGDREPLQADGDGDGDVDVYGAGVEGNSGRADALAASYAAQLELLGQWQWAVFVLQHLELSVSRERGIKALLARQVASITGAAERFLVEQLQVPSSWVSGARATAARYADDRYAEYRHHLLAGAGAEEAAHAVAVDALAPEALIRGDNELLLALFAPFYTGPKPPAGWADGGACYVAYVSGSGPAAPPRLRGDDLTHRVARAEMAARIPDSPGSGAGAYVEVETVLADARGYVDALLA